jgi:hypothetical protein
MSKRGARRFDLALFIVWPIVASLLTVLLRANLLVSTILFLILPSAYLSFRRPEFVRKALIFSCVSTPIFIVADYIAGTTGAWAFPFSVFGRRLFGVTPFEAVIWMAAWTYCVIIFYEYFLDKDCTDTRTHKALKILFAVLTLIFLIFLATVSITGAFVTIPYFYLVFGMCFALFRSCARSFIFLRFSRSSRQPRRISVSAPCSGSS